MGLHHLFKDLPDPRGRSGREYHLGGLLSLIILSQLLGRTGLLAAHRLGRSMSREELTAIGIYRATTPAHGTLTALMNRIDPVSLSDVFGQIMMKGMANDAHICLDGKTMRATKDENGAAVHCVTAFCADLRASLGLEGDVGKGLEIPTALRLLERLDLKGKVITGDALFCTQPLVQKIIEKEADYLLPVKGNQQNLQEELITAFETPVFPPQDL